MMKHKTSFFYFFGLLAGAFVLLSGCADDVLPVTPAPASYTEGKGFFRWNGSTSVYVGEGIDQSVAEAAFGRTSLPVRWADRLSSSGGIHLELCAHIDGMDTPEGYVLQVAPDQVTVQATGNAGLFYGIQTLLQLADAGNGKIRSACVTDAPRFAYRGVMLDVSRHFRSVDFVKKQIDLLSSYKLNRLHLHLTDAAGWRMEIKKYPRLTGFAAWRKGDAWKDWWNGKREYAEEGDSLARGGYYTQADLRELVEYARRHCMVIVPEIEMPSHSEEVLAAYPELSCTHEPYKQSDFCIGNEQTFRFLEDVLDEVMAVFPSKYIHVGGDEAAKTSWKTCPLCRKRMEQEGLHNVEQLQGYLIRRICDYLEANGRELLGWDEILDGGVPQGATVMSWRGEEGGLRAIRSGHRAIMSPGAYCYLDAYQDAPYSQPEAIGGYLPLHKVYGYEPASASLTSHERKLLEGVQANVWAEYIVTDEHMEYMLYPRAVALAEVAWTQPGRKSWESFRRRVLQLVPRMRAEGYHPFDYAKEIGNRPEVLKPVNHLAVGKKVIFNAPYWPNYPANGEKILTDGLRGGWNYNDGRWLGFADNCRMDVTIDLEKVETIRSVSACFMQICGPDVYMPATVILSASDDGKEFRTLTEINHPVMKDDAVTFKEFGWEGETRARFIRYQALPDSRHGGIQFVDEIIVK